MRYCSIAATCSGEVGTLNRKRWWHKLHPEAFIHRQVKPYLREWPVDVLVYRTPAWLPLLKISIAVILWAIAIYVHAYPAYYIGRIYAFFEFERILHLNPVDAGLFTDLALGIIILIGGWHWFLYMHERLREMTDALITIRSMDRILVFTWQSHQRAIHVVQPVEIARLEIARSIFDRLVSCSDVTVFFKDGRFIKLRSLYKCERAFRTIQDMMF